MSDDAQILTLSSLEHSLSETQAIGANAEPTSSDALALVRAASSDPDGFLDMLRPLGVGDLYRVIVRLSQLAAFAIDVAGYDHEVLAAKIRAHEARQ